MALKVDMIVKEEKQGTRQCNLRNIPTMAALYVPLLFLILPF